MTERSKQQMAGLSRGREEWRDEEVKGRERARSEENIQTEKKLEEERKKTVGNR